MIKGISIPVLTPYKFYPATAITADGVNFQNIDNVEYHNQDWYGVYNNQWTQPVPRYWNDYTPGIDFQIYFEDTDITYANLSASIIDLSGSVVQSLSKEQTHVYVAGDKFQVRFYADQLLGVADGFYRIKIFESGGDDIYYSEIIEIKDTFDYCYPLEYSNYENDFGLIFSSGSTSFTGKILIPSRSYKPVPASEKNNYMDDNGIMTTLRSVPKRVYQLESSLVPAWFYEKIALIFSCSELTFNKSTVNSAEIPDSNLFEGSDTVTFSSEIELSEFPSKDTYLMYQYDENVETITELLTGWTNGATYDEWETFTESGTTITRAYSSGADPKESCDSNSIAVTSGHDYLIELNLVYATGVANNPNLEILSGSVDIALSDGKNVILYTAVATTSITLTLYGNSAEEVDFSATCSMKSIN